MIRPSVSLLQLEARRPGRQTRLEKKSTLLLCTAVKPLLRTLQRLGSGCRTVAYALATLIHARIRQALSTCFTYCCDQPRLLSNAGNGVHRILLHALYRLIFIWVTCREPFFSHANPVLSYKTHSCDKSRHRVRKQLSILHHAVFSVRLPTATYGLSESCSVKRNAYRTPFSATWYNIDGFDGQTPKFRICPRVNQRSVSNCDILSNS